MKLLPEDVTWALKNYFGLIFAIEEEKIIVRGKLSFTAKYDETNGNYIVNPSEIDNFVVSDVYEIEIRITNTAKEYPVVKEVGGRLLKLAQSQKIDSRNLHVYSGSLENILCTVGPVDHILVTENLSFQDLIERILVPFFYDSSYYEKYGKRLRPDYSHEIWGVIENYFDLGSLSTQEIKAFVKDKLIGSKQWPSIKKYLVDNQPLRGHLSCFVCGGDRIRSCHSRVFRGLVKIKYDSIF